MSNTDRISSSVDLDEEIVRAVRGKIKITQIKILKILKF